jgi:Protein of unknown function (DUF2397)
MTVARFVGSGPIRLAEMAPLSADELELLLFLLECVLTERPVEGRREAVLQHQRLRLVLEEPPPESSTTVLTTSVGRFTVPAYTLIVESTAQAGAATSG